MGYSFEYDAGNNVLRCSWEGPLTDEVLLSGDAAARKLIAQRPNCRGIEDFTKVTTFAASSETVRRIAMKPPAYGSEQDVLFVAPTDVIYGMARMFLMLGEEKRPHGQVVRSMEAAYRLLGMNSPQFSRVDVE